MALDTRTRVRPNGPGTPVHISHPGPAEPDRIQCARGTLKRVSATLTPGKTICESIADALAPHGLRAAALRFDGLTFAPLRYVRPSYCPDGTRIAFYTKTYAPPGTVRVETVAATWGNKDGMPFIHMHGVWSDAEGTHVGGHILPYEAIVARPARLRAVGTSEVAFGVFHDHETGFDLFGLAPDTPGTAEGTFVALRLRPNVDLVKGIEDACRAKGIRSARILSGIGSTAGVDLNGQPTVMKLPTEHVITGGSIEPDSHGNPRLEVTTELVDVDGIVHRGTPTRGENPVLICFELFLEVT
ncbi:DNA-binding protein [Roseovarius gahaiensis]|uniref:DNA-binding protein n=1 Tax=Roseovarius gahaiensis TaxID=2716691 RepID=A0A967BC75_9RHOB|nr:DUF296 domain-containing protein [Roseovarius gahaiensis]NHQ75315.1 DNA-binding protein [Roseovarius gahaiensis]